MKKCAALLALVLAFMLPATREAGADPIAVDLELVLMADVSGSVDTADFNLQKAGFVNAFKSAALVNAIQAGSIGSIAVSLVYWSTGAVQSVGWTLVNDAASALAFANAIDAVARPSSGGTAMTNALNFTSGLFANNYTGTRNVIDVSGDGSESDACAFSEATCVPLQNARDAFLNANPGKNTINALWIDDRDFFGDDPSDAINAIAYGSANVIGGPGAFQSIVQSFPEFEEAIEAKLIKEVKPVPDAGSTLGLISMALLGLGALRRRS